MVEGLEIRIAGARELPLPGIVLIGAVFEKTERIGIPARDIEIGPDREMIKRQRPAHEIVDHVAARRMRPDDIGLRLVEAHHHVRGVAAEIHHMRRVGLGDR
jgi:hypothetical protein